MAFPLSSGGTGRFNTTSVGELPFAWRAASPGDYAKWSGLMLVEGWSGRYGEHGRRSWPGLRPAMRRRRARTPPGPAGDTRPAIMFRLARAGGHPAPA